MSNFFIVNEMLEKRNIIKYYSTNINIEGCCFNFLQMSISVHFFFWPCPKRFDQRFDQKRCPKNQKMLPQQKYGVRWLKSGSEKNHSGDCHQIHHLRNLPQIGYLCFCPHFLGSGQLHWWIQNLSIPCINTTIYACWIAFNNVFSF